MNKKDNGGAAFPDARDEVAIMLMMRRLEVNPGLFSDHKFLARQSYALADAMLAARISNAD